MLKALSVAKFYFIFIFILVMIIIPKSNITFYKSVVLVTLMLSMNARS